MAQAGRFDQLWSAIVDIGRDPATGGYRRFAWTEPDLKMREWFADECASRGLDLIEGRMGNQWAWWSDRDIDASGGIVTRSHQDSVPDGGAFEGPSGVASALAAIEMLRASGTAQHRGIGVVNFVDEEGGRFVVSCIGARVITGALSPERALALRDTVDVTRAEA